MIKLRPGQIEVAQYKNGYMAVPAVPGAGKTTVLAYLAANLIEEDRVGNGKILIVTYMNSAVSNFRSKIGDFLQVRGLSRNRGYEVRTLHSLALNIVKKKPEYLLINNEFNIIDPAIRGRLIRELLEDWIRDHSKTFLKYFDYDPNNPGYQKALKRWKEEDFPRLIKFMISQFKLYGLARDRISDLQRSYNHNSYLDWTFSIFKEYDRVLHHQGLLDFDDLVLQALNLLKKDKQFLKRLQQKYTYIFEDEAQDSNILLGEILSMLAEEKGNLVRVGDSNQAIMGTFTNANPEIFREYIQKEKVEKCSILYSSRSTEDIINLANELVRWTTEDHPQIECRKALEKKYIYPVAKDDPFPNPRTDGYTIAGRAFQTSIDEIEDVSRLAARYVTKNPDKTIAILVPYNNLIDAMVEELDKYEVEYESFNDQLTEKLKTIEDFRNIVNYLAEPHQTNTLIKLLKRVLLKDCQKSDLNFLDSLFKKYSPAELIYPIGGSVQFHKYVTGLVPEEVITVFEEILERIRLWIEASVQLPPDELVLFLAEEIKLKEEELAIFQNMALQIKAELNKNPHWRLHEIADELPRLEGSFSQFTRKIYERKGYEPQPGTITITTYHKSKGLEWDTVFITWLTDNYFPSSVNDKFRSEYYYLKDDYSNPVAIAKARLEDLIYSTPNNNPLKEANIEVINERLRLLYVAITRAKKNILLSAHREIVYDNGNRKKVNLARPFSVLIDYINKERESYAQ